MGKHAAALAKKSLEMAILQLKLAIELIHIEDEDPIAMIDDAVKAAQRAKDLLK
jgi:hypothetical protein